MIGETSVKLCCSILILPTKIQWFKELGWQNIHTSRWRCRSTNPKGKYSHTPNSCSSGREYQDPSSLAEVASCPYIHTGQQSGMQVAFTLLLHLAWLRKRDRDQNTHVVQIQPPHKAISPFLTFTSTEFLTINCQPIIKYLAQKDVATWVGLGASGFAADRPTFSSINCVIAGFVLAPYSWVTNGTYINPYLYL